MLQIPSKLLATETIIMVIFLALLVMGGVYTFGTYRYDKDKKQAGLVMLGTAGVIASMSVMPWILDHLHEQSDHVMSATSLIEGLRDLLRTK